MPAKKRAVLWASLAFALFGFLAGVYLTRVHYDVYMNPQAHLCNVSQTINCDTVALSSYAVRFGVPVSVWTILGYTAFLFFQVLGLRIPYNPKAKRPPVWPSGLYFLLASFTLAATIPLIII